MNQPQMTPEQFIQMLQAQNATLSKYLTALIKKYGKEQVIYAAGKAPCIELELSEEDLGGAGAYVCSHGKGKEEGSVLLVLQRVPLPGKQH